MHFIWDGPGLGGFFVRITFMAFIALGMIGALAKITHVNPGRIADVGSSAFYITAFVYLLGQVLVFIGRVRKTI